MSNLIAITMAKTTIHNPSEPRHFMRLLPVERLVTLRLGEIVLAQSTSALRLLEVGKDFYPPALYLPMEDAVVPLRRSERTSHCPLKGDAVYFDLVLENETTSIRDIAWSYQTPFDFSIDIKDLISFYTDKITVEEHPL